MGSKLTRNFATREELEQAGIIDADLFEDTLASLPTTAPLSIDGVSVVTGSKVLFGQLNRIYQATVSGATVSWEDISGSDLSDTQKVLIDQGTVYNNDIVQNQSGSWNIANDGKAGGGSGEVNTASNVGGQAPIFKQKTGVDLEFRSLQGGGATTVTQTGDTITISSTDTNTGEANTNSNAGATGAGLVKTKVGVDTPIKRLKAGTNISLTENTDDVEINASGEANTNSNAGATGATLVKTKVGVDTPIKRLTAGANVSLTENTNDIQISASGEANTNSNAGSTGATLVKAKSGVDTPIKRLKAGTNITLTENADDVEISAAGGGGGGRNIAYGAIVAEQSWQQSIHGFGPLTTGLNATITKASASTKLQVKIVKTNNGGASNLLPPYYTPETSGIYLQSGGTDVEMYASLVKTSGGIVEQARLALFFLQPQYLIHNPYEWILEGFGAGVHQFAFQLNFAQVNDSAAILNMRMMIEEI